MPSDTRLVLATIDERVSRGDLPGALAAILDAGRGSADPRKLAFAAARALRAWGRTIEAIDAVPPTPAAKGDTLDDIRVLAWRARVTGSASSAVDLSLLACDLSGNDVGDLIELGAALLQAGRAYDAGEMFRRARERDGASIDATLGLVQVCLAEGRLLDALSLLESALGLHPREPSLLGQRAALLGRLDRNDEAVAAYREALHVVPPASADEFSIGLGVALCHAGRTREGAEMLVHALPRAPLLHGYLQLGPALLALGDYEHGWSMFEHRWLAPPLLSMRAELGIPPLQGQDVKGNTVLVRAEQGIGDNVQFARFLPILRERGANVVFQPLRGLDAFSLRFPGIDHLVREGEPLPPCDYFVNLMSLPGALGTRVDAVPVSIPYLSIDPVASEAWSRRAGRSDRMRVGIAWAGRPEHKRDRHRSIALDDLAPVLAVPGVRFVALQKGNALESAERVPEQVDWISLGPELETLEDAADTLSTLDLLICVDTGLAHIAGAIGLEVWMLVAVPPDFRWLETGERTRWYPTMRLFRQSARGEWGAPISAIARALEDRVRGDRSTVSDSRIDAEPPIEADGIARLAVCRATRYGYLQYPPHATPAGVAVHRYGEWQRSLLEDLARLTPHGGVLVEVGSGFGAHTIPLARVLGPHGTLLAWEHDPPARALLARNLHTHGMHRVQLMWRRLVSAGRAFDDQVETIDQLMLFRLSGIKLSCDDRPGEILGGASATLWRCRPWICASATDESSSITALSTFQEHGYIVFRTRLARYRDDNFFRSPPADGDMGFDHALLAWPEERDLPGLSPAWERAA